MKRWRGGGKRRYLMEKDFQDARTEGGDLFYNGWSLRKRGNRPSPFNWEGGGKGRNCRAIHKKKGAVDVDAGGGRRFFACAQSGRKEMMRRQKREGSQRSCRSGILR